MSKEKDITNKSEQIPLLTGFIAQNRKKSYQKKNQTNKTNMHLDMVTKEARGFPDSSVVKNPPAKQEERVRFLGREDLLEKEMATHFSILAWEIP